MSLITTPSDWDDDELDTFSGLTGDLRAIRLRHENDPEPRLLRAARADVLPPEAQAGVAAYLESSAWGRALAQGLLSTRELDTDDLDAMSETRILERVRREAPAAPSTLTRRRTRLRHRLAWRLRPRCWPP